MKPRTVLSMEQALSLSYGTLRFVQLGWRVIRLESAPAEGQATPGDPNRYVGNLVAEPDRRSYFIAPNVGKEAIALDLKSEEGRHTLRRIVRELPVDLFCCNTLPKRYEQLGIDYKTLSAENPDLIWAGISALGPEEPDTPGYDPALQGMLGYMALTGQPDGPPTLCGVPFVDLKAGDEVFAQTMLALAEQAEGAQESRGKRIDISMAQGAVSWLQTTLPLLDLGASGAAVRRSGNEHREFVPVNVYPTADGHIYLAVGNDVQWTRLTALPDFACLASETRSTNAGRKEERRAIHAEITEITGRRTTDDLFAELKKAGLPATPVNEIDQVASLPFIEPKLGRTELPDGTQVRLPPPAVGTHSGPYPLAPRYGADTVRILRDVGMGEEEIEGLRARRIIYGADQEV